MSEKQGVGNGAKMREALESVSHINDDGYWNGAADICNIVAKAKAALSESARNCDRFNTLEDALAGWREVSPDESGPFDNWLFAEAKGDAK